MGLRVVCEETYGRARVVRKTVNFVGKCSTLALNVYILFVFFILYLHVCSWHDFI